MLLRAAIVFLLVLNLGVAAWWLAGGNAAPAKPGVTITDDVGVSRLRLVGEAVRAKPAAPASVPGSGPVTPAAVPGSVAATDPLAASAAMPAVALPAPSCLRFGPFADAATRDAVRPALQPLAERMIARETQGKSARGWRVYLPVQPSRDAAKAVVEQLKAAGLSDLYIIANGDEANSIALGRYGGEESARRREAQLAAKGFTARAEPLSDSPAQWWLDARLNVGVPAAALGSVAPSRPLDCATLR